MTAFLSSPAHFRLLGFTLASDDVTPSPSKSRPTDRGIVTVNPDPRLSLSLNPDNFNLDDTTLKKLQAIPRFKSLLPPPTPTKSLWSSTPLFIPYPEPVPPSQFKKPELELSHAIYQFLALHQKRIYHEARVVTRTQVSLASDIKRLEKYSETSFSDALQNQSKLRSQTTKLTTSISLMHQEVAKTRYYLQNVFTSLRKTRDTLDLLLMREGEVCEMDSQQYPILHKLTYHHRTARPRSYHPQCHNKVPDPSEDKSRASLDFPPGRSWSVSRSNLRHISAHALPLRHRDSVGSLEETISLDPSQDLAQDLSNGTSILAGAVSKVHFANSKAYRHLPLELSSAGTSSSSTNVSLSRIQDQMGQGLTKQADGKKKNSNLRATLSLVNLKSLRKTPEGPPKPLNAKDRLHQIAGASPKMAVTNGSQLSRWLPSIFQRGSDPSASPSRPQVGTLATPSPSLPDLEPIDYRIVLSTTTADHGISGTDHPHRSLLNSLPEPSPPAPRVNAKYVSATSVPPKPSSGRRPRLPSFDGKPAPLPTEFIASPLQNEIG